MSSSLPVVVLCPLRLEAKAVEKGVAGLANVRVVQTGVGRDAVLRALESAAKGASSARFILAGTCGGLCPVDDVPPIGAVIDEHGNRWIPPLRIGGSAGVTLIGVDDVVSSPADKKALHERTGAAIVDMESHAFAKACTERSLRWGVVRGVSDTPDETLPSEVLHWIDGAGNTRTARAMRDLALKPRLIGPMRAVMRRSGRVLPIMGRAVAEMVRAGA